MNRLSNKGLDFVAKAINKDFIISFITQIEYHGYENVSKSSEEFISLADVIEVDKHITLTCIDLRKNYKVEYVMQHHCLTPRYIIANYNFTLIYNVGFNIKIVVYYIPSGS